MRFRLKTRVRLMAFYIMVLMSVVISAGAVVFTGVNRASSSDSRSNITIHDELDKDAAYVSKLKLVDLSTGTEPFDKNDSPGNDSSASNKIVRSFDTVVYNYEYTITPDSATDYYKRGRVGFRIELPYDKSKVRFDEDAMTWVDKTPGYEAKTTMEQINGVQTQVFIAYRLLEPTPTVSTTIPGTSTIKIHLKVGAAENGFRFHPTVKAWTVPNDEQHRMMTCDTEDVTVSATPQIDIKVEKANPSYTDTGEVDFDGAPGWFNYGKGKMKGALSDFGLAVDLRWADKSKGLKGIEIPKGPISFDLTISNAWRDTGSSTNHANRGDLQPLLWDWTKMGSAQTNGRTSSLGLHILPVRELAGFASSSHDGPYYFYDTIDGKNVSKNTCTYRSGHFTVTEVLNPDNTKTLHVTLDNYKIDPDSFPTDSADVKKTVFNSNFVDGKGNVQVGQISSARFQLFSPTYTSDGKYVKDLYNHDVTLQQDLTIASGITATGASGAKVSQQSYTGNDHEWLSFAMRPAFWQVLSYLCPYQNTVFWNGMDCYGWASDDARRGTDSALQGEDIAVLTGYQTRNVNSVMGVELVKIDPNVIEVPDSPRFLDDRPSWNNNSVSPNLYAKPPKIKYGVRADGKAWSSDQEQNEADISSLVYYDTPAEAKRHGLICGILFGDSGAAPADYYLDSYVRHFGPGLVLRVKDGAKLGSVAQLTGVVYAWTREQLAGSNGAPAVYASDEEWRNWTYGINPIDFMSKVRPQYRYGSDGHYRKAQYDETGYIGQDSPDSNLGDSVYIVGERPRVDVTTEQTNKADGTVKTVFDLGNAERIVDWKISANADTMKSSIGKTHDTDLYVTATLPKGLSYNPGSSYLDGEYEQGDSSGGSIKNGVPLEPVITANGDGTTTLQWTIRGVKSDGTNHYVHYSTTIGDMVNPDNDVQDGQKFDTIVRIKSRLNKALPTWNRKTAAVFSIKISKLRSSAVATSAEPSLNDVDREIGFHDRLGINDKANLYAVAIMPYSKSDRGGFTGSYKMSALTVSTENEDLHAVEVWFTNDVRYRAVDPLKITRDEVKGWHKAMLDVSTGTVTIPSGYEAPTAWGVTADAVSTQGSYDFRVRLKPKGNAPGDLYRAIWTDGDSTVSATAVVVSRSVSGVQWLDRNRDGVRQDTDYLMPGVKVSLVDKTTGKTLMGLDGKELSTVTDKNGHYELTGVPAGSGYQLRFKPALKTNWDRLSVTVKKAPGSTPETDSSGIGVMKTTSGNVEYAYIDLAEFPAADKMTSSVYIDSNENSGVLDGHPVNLMFTISKSLVGRDNGEWSPEDRYKAIIAPMDASSDLSLLSVAQNGNNGGENKTVVTSDGILFTDPSSKTVMVDTDRLLSMPTGRYSWKISEDATSKVANVLYDKSEYVVKVVSSIDPVSLTTSLSLTIDKNGQGIGSTDIRFKNRYVGMGEMPMTGSNQLIWLTILVAVMSIVISVVSIDSIRSRRN